MLVFLDSYCQGVAAVQLLYAAKERNSCVREQDLSDEEGWTGGNVVGGCRGAETTKETLLLLEPEVFDLKKIKLCSCEREVRRQNILFLLVYLYSFFPLDVYMLLYILMLLFLQ